LTRALEKVKPPNAQAFLGLAALKMRQQLVDIVRQQNGARSRSPAKLNPLFRIAIEPLIRAAVTGAGNSSVFHRCSSRVFCRANSALAKSQIERLPPPKEVDIQERRSIQSNRHSTK
jgi:hypothetical protein